MVGYDPNVNDYESSNGNDKNSKFLHANNLSKLPRFDAYINQTTFSKRLPIYKRLDLFYDTLIHDPPNIWLANLATNLTEYSISIDSMVKLSKSGHTCTYML